MNLTKNLWTYGPGGGWSFFSHGGDEYGNCTLYWSCPWLGTIVWRYPTGHRQTDVEIPMDWRDNEGWAVWAKRVTFGKDWDDA